MVYIRCFCENVMTEQDGSTTIAKNLDWLERLPIFQRDKLRVCRNMPEEVQALTNTAPATTIGNTESQDALRLEKLRLKWERRELFRKLLRRSKQRQVNEGPEGLT